MPWIVHASMLVARKTPSAAHSTHEHASATRVHAPARSRYCTWPSSVVLCLLDFIAVHLSTIMFFYIALLSLYVLPKFAMHPRKWRQFLKRLLRSTVRRRHHKQKKEQKKRKRWKQKKEKKKRKRQTLCVSQKVKLHVVPLLALKKAGLAKSLVPLSDRSHWSELGSEPLPCWWNHWTSSAECSKAKMPENGWKWDVPVLRSLMSCQVLPIDGTDMQDNALCVCVRMLDFESFSCDSASLSL